MVENNQAKSKAEIIKLAEKEHDFLRGELVHLKDCQVKFLTFSVTATAVILGIIGRSSLMYSTSSNLLIGSMWLIPLAVLLPAWWIFFDKATTITRIVGYFRLLENIILGEVVPPVFLGWENALEESRKQNPKGGRYVDMGSKLHYTLHKKMEKESSQREITECLRSTPKGFALLKHTLSGSCRQERKL